MNEFDPIHCQVGQRLYFSPPRRPISRSRFGQPAAGSEARSPTSRGRRMAVLHAVRDAQGPHTRTHCALSAANVRPASARRTRQDDTKDVSRVRRGHNRPGGRPAGRDAGRAAAEGTAVQGFSSTVRRPVAHRDARSGAGLISPHIRHDHTFDLTGVLLESDEHSDTYSAHTLSPPPPVPQHG